MLFFELLFEDDSILAVNKASGIPSHSQTRDLSVGTPRTVEALVKSTHPEAMLLHRLDNGTSGVLLFAKNNSVFNVMREKFKLKLIKKYYIAWSDSGVITDPSFKKLPLTLSLPIAHHPKSAKRMVVVPEGKKISIRGKAYPALTRIHKIESIALDGTRFLKCAVEIETGVTHQIRVHLKHLGLPLAGDPIYNAKSPNRFRLGLHAKQVSFELEGRQYQIEAPEPASLRASIE